MGYNVSQLQCSFRVEVFVKTLEFGMQVPRFEPPTVVTIIASLAETVEEKYLPHFLIKNKTIQIVDEWINNSKNTLFVMFSNEILLSSG